jgi:hypothetical protein
MLINQKLLNMGGDSQEEDEEESKNSIEMLFHN